MESNWSLVEFQWEGKARFFALCFTKCEIAKHLFILIRHDVTVPKGSFLWCTWIVLLKRNRLDPWFSFPDCQLPICGKLLYKMTPFLKDTSHCFQRGCQSPRKEKVCSRCSLRKVGGVVWALTSFSLLELSAVLHLCLWLGACKFHIHSGFGIQQSMQKACYLLETYSWCGAAHKWLSHGQDIWSDYF